MPKDSSPRAAVLAQLCASVDRFPCEATLHAEGTLAVVTASALRRTPAYGWAWWPRASSLVSPLVVPSTAVDPARCWAEQLAAAARVAFARELAVVLARALPREVIIRIHLEVFWGGAA